MATNKPTIPCPGLKRSCVAYPFSVVCMLIDPFSVVNSEAIQKGIHWNRWRWSKGWSFPCTGIPRLQGRERTLQVHTRVPFPVRR